MSDIESKRGKKPLAKGKKKKVSDILIGAIQLERNRKKKAKA